MVQLPIEYIGDVVLGNKNGAEMPPQFAMAIMPPVANAVAVEPWTVAVRCYRIQTLVFLVARRQAMIEDRQR